MDTGSTPTGNRPQWYLAQTKPRQEQIAATTVADRKAARVFAPREPQKRIWRGRVQILLGPLFPGYIFVSPDPDKPAWPAIRYARGMTRIVSFGANDPAVVPDGVVAALQNRCDPDGILQDGPEFAPGDEVRFLTGPFADMVSRIDTITPDQRIGLLLDLMGRSVRMTANSRDLVRVNAS